VSEVTTMRRRDGQGMAAGRYEFDRPEPEPEPEPLWDDLPSR
jgi:hypothetical protein